MRVVAVTAVLSPDLAWGGELGFRTRTSSASMRYWRAGAVYVAKHCKDENG